MGKTSVESGSQRFPSEKRLVSKNRNPGDISFLLLVAEDFSVHSGWNSQGFWALFWHRFGNWRMSIKSKFLRAPFTVVYNLMYKLVQWLCGIDLPYTVIVGRRVKLEHFGGMILVAKRIGNDVIIRQNVTLGIATGNKDDKQRPTIGDRVQIGAGAVIIGGINLGADVVVGANAVVVKDVPNGDTVAGVPAKSLREI